MGSHSFISSSQNLTQIHFPNLSQISGSEIEDEIIPDWKQKTVFKASVAILSLSLICVNGGVLVAILRKGLRPLNTMIANLAIVLIFATGSLSFWILELDKIFKQLWLSTLFSYIRMMSVNLSSLAMASIIYEIVQSLNGNTIGLLDVRRPIALMWLASSLGATPTLVTTLLDHQLKTSTLVNFYIGLVYEVCRTLIFHVGVSIYLLYEFCQEHSKLAIFYKFANKTNGARKTMWLISLNSIVFVLSWIPFGALLGFYNNIFRLLDGNEFEAENQSNEKSPLLFDIFFFLFYIYIFCMPLLLTLATNEGCIKKRRIQPKEEEDGRRTITQRGDTTLNISSSSSSSSNNNSSNNNNNNNELLCEEQEVEENVIDYNALFPFVVMGNRECNDDEEDNDSEEIPQFHKETLV